MALTSDSVFLAAGRELSRFAAYIGHSPDGLRRSANKVSALGHIDQHYIPHFAQLVWQVVDQDARLAIYVCDEIELQRKARRRVHTAVIVLIYLKTSKFPNNHQSTTKIKIIDRHPPPSFLAPYPATIPRNNLLITRPILLNLYPTIQNLLRFEVLPASDSQSVDVNDETTCLAFSLATHMPERELCFVNSATFLSN